MNERQKKPSVGFWGAWNDRKPPPPGPSGCAVLVLTLALIVVLVGYPLSIGPVNWIYWHVPLPDWLADSFFPAVYEPYSWAIAQSETATDFDKWWISLWVDIGTPGANSVRY